MTDNYIYGRNACFEALCAGRAIEKLLVQKGSREEGTLLSILQIAKKKGISTKYLDKEAFGNLLGEVNHQGVALLAESASYVEVEDMLNLAKERGEPPFLLICEHLQDPHNLGAILRSAEGAGVHGVIISKRHAVGLSGAVAKTAAGALEHMLVAKVSSIPQLIQKLQEKGLFVACADMDGSSIYETDLTGPLALVVGAEHEGVSRLVKEKSDFVISLPMKGKVSSLNASVAAGIMIYEIMHQRDRG